MEQGSASRTAIGTAFLRAAHQLLDGPTLVLPDPVALRLLGSDGEAQVRAAVPRLAEPRARHLRANVVLRSRWAEDRLAIAAAAGAEQYLLIGAGFDTFGWRQPHWARALDIIEIDHPDTQRAKRSAFSRAGFATPTNVRFADVDFERESLTDALGRHHIATDRCTFASWLGVTMYLTTDAIEATLRTFTQFPEGSELVLTYLQPPTSLRGGVLARIVAHAGEPFVSYFTPDGITRLLQRTGFREVQLLSVEEGAAYFAGSTLAPPDRMSIARAVR